MPYCPHSETVREKRLVQVWEWEEAGTVDQK